MIFQLGTIQPNNLGIVSQSQGQAGLVTFLNQIITLLYTIGGLFVLVNFITAGYQYLGSNGDPQKITNAGNKILHSLIGLIFIVASFIIGALLGYLLFKDSTAIIKPSFYILN